MSIKVGDLIMNKFGNLGMITSLVYHPTFKSYNSGYVEWYPYNPKQGKINLSISKLQEYRDNFTGYMFLEKRGARVE